MKTILFILFTISSFAYAKINVCASIPPQAFFIQKIAGDLVDVTILVPPGSSPATYAPKPSQLKRIKEASLYFTIGVAFEKQWIQRFSSINEDLKIIDTTAGIKKIAMQSGLELHGDHAHAAHNEHDDHDHSGLDPHVWLDPNLVKLQATAIANALAQIDTTNAVIYEKNLESFINELDALDTKIKSMLSSTDKKSFIVFHPSYGYFAKAYGLTQVAIEDEGKEPSLRYVKEVIEYAKAHNIKTVFVAPQFSQKSAKQIAEHIDGNVASINPLSEQWDTNLLDIATSFQRNLDFQGNKGFENQQ